MPGTLVTHMLLHYRNILLGKVCVKDFILRDFSKLIISITMINHVQIQDVKIAKNSKRCVCLRITLVFKKHNLKYSRLMINLAPN